MGLGEGRLKVGFGLPPTPGKTGTALNATGKTQRMTDDRNSPPPSHGYATDWTRWLLRSVRGRGIEVRQNLAKTDDNIVLRNQMTSPLQAISRASGARHEEIAPQ